MRDGLSLLLHGSVVSHGEMAVEDDYVAATDDVEAARTDQIGVTAGQQRARGARIRPVDVRGGRVGDVVQWRREAVGRVEEEVDALGGAVQRGRLDQRPVQHVAVEDLHWCADWGYAVAR